MSWKRKHSAVIPPELQASLPTQLTIRIVRGSLYQRGFRVRQVTLVTTLLDVGLYPAADILQAYLRRWRMEMCLDDLKTTLGMNTLSCKSPEMVRKELLMHLIAHNLVRYTMIQARWNTAPNSNASASKEPSMHCASLLTPWPRRAQKTNAKSFGSVYCARSLRT